MRFAALLMAGVMAVVPMAGSAEAAVYGGPSCLADNVFGGYYSNYNTTFIGGELAEVMVSGEGWADLDIYIYDQWGNLVAFDTDYTDQCYASFVPRVTGDFTIQVVNRGSYSNPFTICVA